MIFVLVSLVLNIRSAVGEIINPYNILKMENKFKLNIIMGLMMVILLVQIFMKPSVIINDRDWDIKYELRDLKKTFNQSQMKELEESINQNDQLLTMIDEYEKTSKILLAQNKEFLMELQSEREELYGCFMTS